MPRLRRKTKADRGPLPVWAAWVVIAGVAIILLAGIGVGVAKMTGSEHSPTSRSASSAPTPPPTSSLPAGASQREREDAIANQPMPEGDSSNLDPSNFKPKPEVQATTPGLNLPSGKKTDAGVRTGFTHTPEGAVAQLAALNQAAYTNLDAQAGRNAYTAFAMPGAVPLEDWNPTKTVMRYYTDSPDTDPTRMRAQFVPVQGLIKGSVGNNFTVVCVNGQLTYTYKSESNRVAVWDCARMRWDDKGDRWMIAAGATPARAPLTWPRSELSYRAGFRDLSNVPE